MARSERSRVSAGAGALTSSKSVIALTADSVTEATSRAIRDACLIVKIEIEITTIAASATTVTWNLAKDAAGDFGITPEVTTTITVGATTATKGSVCALIDCDHIKTANAVSGTVYLVAKTNTGTCTITKALLFWVP